MSVFAHLCYNRWSDGPERRSGPRNQEEALSMTDFVRGFGSFVASKVEDHPERARRWLSTAYSLVGWKAAHFPDRQDPRARSAS